MQKEVRDELIMETAFDNFFKYKIGVPVRHRADTKDYTPDMALFIIARAVIERIDDQERHTFEKGYHCRMVKFSGSGDVASFAEKEIMSLEEYEQERGDREKHMNEVRHEYRIFEREVLEYFGVTKEEYLYLKDENGKEDTTSKYRVTGMGTTGNKPYLVLTESILTAAGKEFKSEQRQIDSKDQFIKVSSRP